MSKLNVILHGNIVLLRKKNYIKGMIPDLGADHCYRAGPWLGEVTIQPQRDYALEGVKAGSAVFDAAKHIILRGVVENTAAPRYANLIFPIPESITYVVPEEFAIGSGIVGNDLPVVDGFTAGSTTNLKLSTVRILTFDFDIRQLRFGDFTNFHVTLEGPTPGVSHLNVHIYAEPDANRGHGTSEDFARGLQLLRKKDGSAIDLVPVASTGTASGLATAAQLPPMVLPEETEDLISRTRRFALIGLEKKRDGTFTYDQSFSVVRTNTSTCGSGDADEN